MDDGHEECRVAYRKLAGVAAASIRREEALEAELERLRGMETRAREMRDCPRAAGFAGVHQRGTARYILGEA